MDLFDRLFLGLTVVNFGFGIVNCFQGNFSSANFSFAVSGFAFFVGLK